MRIKTLFSIPDGEKVTEKALRRVLISSICSILLCMTCLVSTTWAWFAVSIENKGNIIQVAQWHLEVTITPTVALTEIEETSPVQYENGVYTLQEGVYGIDIQFISNVQDNDLADRPIVYLIMVENDGQTETKYAAMFTLGTDGAYEPIELTYKVESMEQAKLSFCFTRMNPQISNDLRAADFEVEEEKTTPVTTDFVVPGESTDHTQSLTDNETDPAAGSSDDVTATTGHSTVSTTESKTEATTDTVSTEPSSEPTKEVTEPDTTASTEETTGTTEGES